MFLFYGPSGSGKTLMVRAIAHETRSLVFDLTPEFLFEKFDKNTIRKIMYMAFKCAIHYQPAIIYIDQLDRVYPKKGNKLSKA